MRGKYAPNDVFSHCWQGAAVTENQDFIAQELLMRNHEFNLGLLFLTEVDPPNVNFPKGTLCVDTDGHGNSWIRLEVGAMISQIVSD